MYVFIFFSLLININKSTLCSSQLANSSPTLQWRSSTRPYLMHIQCLEQQIKVSTYWMISYQKAGAGEVTPSSICSCRLTPVIMRRYWWLQVGCLMNSLIDCAAVAFWQWPSPVSERSFSGGSVTSSCAISHGESAKHASHGFRCVVQPQCSKS